MTSHISNYILNLAGAVFSRPLQASLVFLIIAVSVSHASTIRDEPILPIPQFAELNEDKIKLGEKLFHDKHISRGSVMSCASCHLMDRSGDDNLKTSISRGDRNGELNTPTMFNVAYNYHITWAGKHNTLETQIFKALTNPNHMAADWDTVLNYLKNHKDYSRQFKKVYAEAVNKKNFLNCVAEYEKSLITPDAPFDQWLYGDDSALDKTALRGYQLFKEIGCISCHQGRNIGGNLFQPIGVFYNHFEIEKRQPNLADMGRYNVTGREQDRHVFRVPSLRNVAVTGPWFHDGSMQTLEEAVERMALLQLGIKLSEEETDLLTTFLKSLTGEYRGKPVTD